jgi:hypothetical protein
MNNPYRWNQINLDLIFGRDFIMDEMLKTLPSAHGNSFGMTAARRMGKTTILRAVEKELRSSMQIYSDSGTAIVPVYIDGLTLPRPLTAQMIWGRILYELNLKLAPHLNSLETPMDFSEFLLCCSQLFSTVEKVPKAIIIFDEIEHIVTHEEWAGAFFANWRALLSNFPDISGNVCAVFSGAREMTSLQHDIGSPLMDVLEWTSLRNLDLPDTYRLMTEPAGLAIDNAVVAFAFEETGGHPMILQYIMQKILNGSHLINSESISRAILDFEKQRAWQFAEWWEKYCDTSSQKIYVSLPIDHSFKKVAVYVDEMGGYEASKAIEILQHVGIAELSADGSQVRRRCLMFSRWATQYARRVAGTAYDAEIAALLEALNPAFREKYISAWAIYDKDMPNYSGAVGEMRDLVTLVLHLVAPDHLIEAVPGFKFERDQNKPTRRQRVTFLFGVANREQGKAVASEDELLEAHALQVASVVTKSYANASALTHTTASRPLAYVAIKQAESILAQLVSRYNENDLEVKTDTEG